MGSAFHQLCPRYRGTLTPTAPTAIMLWDTFTFNRDLLQVEILGRQIFGKRQLKYFLDSFAKATAEKYRCLLVDLSPHSDLTYKLRTNLTRSVYDSFPARKGNINRLIKKEKYFLRLLISTTLKQKKALLQAIEKPQLRAIVQIVYNRMIGYRALPENYRKRLEKDHKRTKREEPPWDGQQ